VRPYLKKPITKKGWWSGLKVKALNSNPSTTKKKKRKKERKVYIKYTNYLNFFWW
jgi:hypothetical protein